MTCSHLDLSTGPDNLVMRAAQVLKRHSGSLRGAAIRLEKRIPLAAGLAGGSSDAAATLLALNRLWQLGLPTSQLAQLAGELGSDISFFFSGSASPCSWCWFQCPSDFRRQRCIKASAYPQSHALVWTCARL
jgi:4-diphosphocytidyl-2-C-methyl-D-erythritol kinase